MYLAKVSLPELAVASALLAFLNPRWSSMIGSSCDPRVFVSERLA